MVITLINPDPKACRFAVRCCSLIVVSALLFSCQRGPGGPDDRGGRGKTVERPAITGVNIQKAQKKQVVDYYETGATVAARNSAVLSSRIMAAILSVDAFEGERVFKGRVLARLDGAEFERRFSQAQSNADEARAAVQSAVENDKLAGLTYERFKNLFDEKVVTPQEFDEVTARRSVAASSLAQARAALERAEAAGNEARVFLSYTNIVSPCDGTVVRKTAEAGSMAMPGVPLMVVEDASGYEVRLDIDEKLFKNIKKGMEVDVTVESAGVTTRGKVTEVGAASNPATRTFHVKISLKHERVISGMYAAVRVPAGVVEAVFAPDGAIVSRGQIKGVYVVGADDVAVFRAVSTGKKAEGGFTEVLSGLSGGEDLISEGVERAVDGGVLKGRGL